MSGIFELIETLWNVNILTVIAPILTSFRINRNIVECKLIPAVSVSVSRGIELIETLWNVNEAPFSSLYIFQ